MPIDASVYGAIRPFEAANPLAQYAQIEQLQNARQQNRLAELALADKQRESAGVDALNQSYAAAFNPETGQTDNSRLLSELAQRGQGSRIPVVQKSIADQQKSLNEADLTKFKVTQEKLGLAAQILGGVKDQDSYDRARVQAQASGLDVSKMPTAYDASFIKERMDQALNAKERMDQYFKEKAFTTPDANAVLGAQTSRANNAATVGASYANAAATREVAKSTKEAARINSGYQSEQGLRKEFEALPEVKNYKQAFPAFKAIEDAKSRNTPQSDINIVYGIAKLYDPNSVVREGEYATVANSPNVPDRIKGYANYIAGGGRLTPKVKEEIFAEAKGRMGTFDQQYQASRKDFENISKNSGVDVNRVFPSPSQPLTNNVPRPVIGNVQGGYKFKGGDPADQNNWVKQ